GPLWQRGNGALALPGRPIQIEHAGETHVRIGVATALVLLGVGFLSPGMYFAYMITCCYVVFGHDFVFFGQLAAYTVVGVTLIAIGIWTFRRSRRHKNSN